MSIRFYFSIFLTTTCCIICTSICAQNNYKYHYEVIKIDSTYDAGANLTIETYVDFLKHQKDKKMNQIIGVSKETLSSFSPSSPLSNLLVDMLFTWSNNYLSQKKLPKADLALLNFGGIRATLHRGNITVGDLFKISPFDNTLAFVYVKGSELEKMFAAFTEKRNAQIGRAHV
jgi:2',3'-cyclic-nucleotide 2'-phosphodiesterase (5'-nucleotidase family)